MKSFLGPIATVIQSALKDVGIPVQLDPLPQTQISDRRIVKKDLPMALSDQEKPVGPDVGYATKLFFVTPPRRREQSWRTTRSAEVDRAVRRSADRAGRRQARWRSLQADSGDAAERSCLVPLVETKTEWAFCNKLSGVTWHPENSIHFIDLTLQP